MGRYTNAEIEKAKMLARKVSAFHQLQVTPLSRTRAATTLLSAVIRCVIWQRARRFSRWLRSKQVCTICDGRVGGCDLCHGSGEIGWREIESLKWGRALSRYRISLNQAPHEFAPWMDPLRLRSYERGLVPLDDWSAMLYHRADLQLDREAARHVSTT